MKTGLFLGKFAPLHKGHQFAIEQAISQVDKLIVLIYDSPKTTLIPLTVRSKWIRKLYPDVEVIDGWLGPEEIGDTEEIKTIQENYVLEILGKRKITHFFSSEFYGEHMSKALNAKNVQIDPERNAVSISATEVRSDPYKYREFLHPIVYKDLVINVVFMGAPSTGKSTIAKEMAEYYNTVWMQEHGRIYWLEHQVKRRLTRKQLEELAVQHIALEDEKLLQANKYLFTDTNAITTKIFGDYYHGSTTARLSQLADENHKRYDLVFVCDTDIPYDNTWDRSGEGNREEFQRRNIAYLKENRIPYIVLSGTLEERKSKVIKILNNFQKFQGAML